ncbi:hypothetical protein QG37_01997 [Candidozyma auris]|nr:hypothetical protein QG37_01997 [[Candida] auris]
MGDAGEMHLAAMRRSPAQRALRVQGAQGTGLRSEGSTGVANALIEYGF